MSRQLENSIKKEQSQQLKEMQQHLGEFYSYKQKRAQIKEMKKHYDNTFNLTIEGQLPQTTEEKKKPLAHALLKHKKPQADKSQGTSFEARTIFFPDFESDD